MNNNPWIVPFHCDKANDQEKPSIKVNRLVGGPLPCETTPDVFWAPLKRALDIFDPAWILWLIHNTPQYLQPHHEFEDAEQESDYDDY